MTDIHYLNGQWVNSKDLKISVFDLSVLRGFGIFDFLRTYHRKPFYLVDHIDRLFNSAKVLEIDVPKTKKEIRDLVFLGIKKNNHLKEFNLRIVVTGGVGPDSVTAGKSSLIIIFSPAIDFPKNYYSNGIKVITYKTKRTFASAKSLEYLAGIVALKHAKRQNAVEALYIDESNKIYEGITSNFFAVLDNKLITPKKGILLGVTRKIVLGLAKKLKIPLLEKDFYTKDMAKFKEAFVSASNKEIMPVVQIDKTKIGNGRVGQITKRLMEGYRKIIENY